MSLQDIVVAIFGQHLKPTGFRKKTANWFRWTDEVYEIVNVQKHPYDGSCYVNVGFSTTRRGTMPWISEPKCEVRFRMEDIEVISLSDLRLLDTIPPAEARCTWEESVADKLVMPTVRVLKKAESIDGLREVLRDDVSSNIFVHKEVRSLLLQAG